MDWEKLFQALPEIIKLIVPGYIFFRIYNFFLDQQLKEFEETIFTSLIASYILRLPIELLALQVGISDTVATILTVLVAILSAGICAWIMRKGLAKKAIKKIGKITGSKSIWIDIFDVERGSRIRCFAEYNHKDVMIEGDVQYYSSCEDGECSLALVNYKITYSSSGNIYKTDERNDVPMFCINTRDIHGLEVVNGQKRK